MTETERKRVTHRALKRACLTGESIRASLLAEGFPENPPDALEAAAARCCVSAACRGCGLPLGADTFAVWTTYWQALYAGCHAACRDAGMKAEAFECQVIDADCNDCAHFRRVSGNKGTCAKTGADVAANPVFASCLPCFEHRKSAPMPGDE
jgi:hypothetical protein